MSYRTIQLRFDGPVGVLQLWRPEVGNAIDPRMVEECHSALDVCDRSASIVVLEGAPTVFCVGADFDAMHATPDDEAADMTRLYSLWSRLSSGPFISIAHARGKVIAGGLGFAAACDLLITEDAAQFMLSELLFGLLPACVMPFLIRRVGLQRAQYLALSTRSISGREAHACGLADACAERSDDLLRKHLLRMRRISKPAIVRYKEYLGELEDSISRSAKLAVAASQRAFTEADLTLRRFSEQGLFPWEQPS